MDISYYYVEKNVLQPSLLSGVGGRVVGVPQGELHIVYQDVCMCRISRKPKKTVNGERGVTAKTRPTGIKLCEECERLYKANKDSEWHKWVVAVEKV